MTSETASLNSMRIDVTLQVLC